MRHLAFVFALTLFVPTTGCDWYFGDDDDDICAFGLADPSFTPEMLRNPETGVCEEFGYYPDYPCDPVCGQPCPGSNSADGARAPIPTWGYCESYCSGQDEQTCVQSPGCRGVYADVEGARSFVACWATDQTGPIQGGSCEGMDAWTCSQYDDCSAVHACNNAGGDQPLDPSECDVGVFQQCVSEKLGCFGNGECDAGETCNADELCLAPPGCDENSDSNGLFDCATQCYGFCVTDTTPACGSLDETTCISRDDCAPFYEGVNCTCDPAGENCQCTDWVFDTCEDAGAETTPA